MHKSNRLFISIALMYGLLGGLIALARLLGPGLIPGNAPRLHGHVMLLGFILMMIYGIALHVLPRFSGRPLHSQRMANWQLYLANAGLPLMIAGWLTWTDWPVFVGGALSYAAIVLFGINIVLTVRASGPAS
jgi:cbb3-type cytochrome oxidase subunit 1